MISESTKKNIKKTYLIMICSTIFLALLIYFICMPFNSGYISIIISIVISLCTTSCLYFFGLKILLNISKAKKLNTDDMPNINNILEDISSKSNINKPQLYITDEEQANIFSIAKNQKKSIICVTKGLLEFLDDSELQAVIAHEVYHIKNNDTFLSTIITVIIGLPIILSDVYSRHLFKKHSNEKRKEKKDGTFTILISLLLSILSPISAKIMEILLDKNRDYSADIYSIKIIGSKDGLASALKKMEYDESPLNLPNISTSHMYIVNPMKSIEGEEVKTLFTTHPSINNRIKNITQTPIEN